MFGYVVVNKEKLNDEMYDQYHSFYCGLCRELSEHYGKLSAVTLNNDMTFLAVLLSGLEEAETSYEKKKCPVHISRTVEIRRNEYTRYAADMTILLSYYKCLDDVKDEGKHKRMLKRLTEPMEALKEKYPDKTKKVEDALNRIGLLEKENSEDLDLLCNTFGEVLGEIFIQPGNIWNRNLYATGYSLGRFIYLMDAYDDLEDDLKKKQFNPLAHLKDREDFDAYIESVLELYMSEAADAFERMPVLEYSEVIRNIIYSGVWTRLEMMKQKKEGKRTSA